MERKNLNFMPGPPPITLVGDAEIAYLNFRRENAKVEITRLQMVELT